MDKGINILHRKSIRLKNYDYTQPGYYFATICTHNHKPIFLLNEEFKSIVRKEWYKTAIVRNYVIPDEYVIMPNHIHGIIITRGTLMHKGGKMTIKVVLEPSDEGGYTVYAPSLPGCISEGNTIDEALENIREAIELYLEPVEDDWVAKEGVLVRELIL